MAQSVSWTDAESIAALIRQVAAPRPAPVIRQAAAPRPIPVPVGSAARIPSVRPRASARPAAAAPAYSAPQEPVVPRLEHTSNSPSDRLDALVAWTLDHHRCTGAFVADDNGLTLAAHGITEAHVALVGPMLSALVGVRTIPGIDASYGSLWLGASMMSWVETRTERGGFCLGAVGPEALTTRAFGQLKEALEVTFRTM